DLTAGNIKSGTDLFGVTGSLIGASGNATNAQVLSGVTYSNSSGAGTGAMPNRSAVTMVPGTTNKTILQGYHNGSGIVQGDSDLTTGNIKNGTVLFGVTGSLISASGNATNTDVLNGVA